MARANTTDRFGLLRQVTPTLVFKLAFDGTAANTGRTGRLDLIRPRLVACHPDLTTDRDTPLIQLTLPPNPPPPK